MRSRNLTPELPPWDAVIASAEYLPSVGVEHSSRQAERAGRQKARALIADYHEQQLLALLEHVRGGFTRLDCGEIDAFELDELIHRYKRSARELWKFCGQTGSDWEREALNSHRTPKKPPA